MSGPGYSQSDPSPEKLPSQGDQGYAVEGPQLQQAERTTEEWLEFARTLPRIAVDDERVLAGDKASSPQFGNNFYLLWLSLATEEPPNGILHQVYAHRAQQQPGWSDFIAANSHLVEQMNTLLEEVYTPFSEIFGHLLDLLNAQDWEGYEALNAAVEHPWGLDALGVYVWDQINPVMQELAAALEANGIDPKQFYG